jgi:hypothetical protein
MLVMTTHRTGERVTHFTFTGPLEDRKQQTTMYTDLLLAVTPDPLSRYHNVGSHVIAAIAGLSLQLAALLETKDLDRDTRRHAISALRKAVIHLSDARTNYRMERHLALTDANRHFLPGYAFFEYDWVPLVGHVVL